MKRTIVILMFLVASCGGDNAAGNNGGGNNGGDTQQCSTERAQTGGDFCGDGSDCPRVTCTCAGGGVSTSSCFNGTCLGSEACEDTCSDQGGWTCKEKPMACEPACANKSCGDDGCGGTCGSCASGESCKDGSCAPGACTPDCSGKSCGDDNGCAGVCKKCSAGESCNTTTKTCEVKPVGSCFFECTIRNSTSSGFSCFDSRTESECQGLSVQVSASGTCKSISTEGFVADCACDSSCAPNWWLCEGTAKTCVF